MAIKTIDDTILQGIAEEIQAKDGGGKMLDTEMRGRIANIPSGWANPTSFVMVSDIQYADEVLPVFISACPDRGQWFIGKVDYANKNQTPIAYICMGAYVIWSGDGMSRAENVLRSGNGWRVDPVAGHYKAAVYAGDKFYIYDISSIPT